MPGRLPRYEDGFTLVELLLVLAILGTLVGIGFFALPDDSGRTANEVARLVQQARFESVKREAATAVLWNAATGRFEVRVGIETCDDAGTLVRTLDVGDRRGVEVDVSIAGGGLIWLPSNVARDCQNEVFAGTGGENAIQIVGRSRTFTVAISAAGFVSVE